MAKLLGQNELNHQVFVLRNRWKKVRQGCAERVAGGGVEDGTVMVVVGEIGGADIGLDGGTVTMVVDGTGKTAGGGGDIALEELLKATRGKSSSSIIKSSSASLSSALSWWWTLRM